MLFGIIHILANFGLVIMDTGFLIKAFAAKPEAVVKGYVVGGIAYFAIPWCLGTLMSLLALALENDPVFPTYPRRMSATEISNGLVLPYSAVAIAGRGGAVAVLLITFMAVTSTLSAQVIAVSSIISFDIYRQYVNRRATDQDVIRWSHIGVIFFGLFAACFSTILHYGKVDLGWTLYMLGVLTCPGIFPTSFAILWKRQSKLAAVVSPTLGLVTGIAVWLGTAYHFYGEVSVATTGLAVPCTWGTAASAMSPAVYSIIISLVKPDNFDWAQFRKEDLALHNGSSDTEAESIRGDQRVEEQRAHYLEDKAKWKRWGAISAIWSLATFLGHWVLWPLPMYAAKYVFGKTFFTAWTVVAIIWVWGTMLIAGFYPLIDGREQIRDVWRLFRTGGNGHKTESGSGSETPVEELATSHSKTG
jgi:urea-proton symporter